MSAPSPPRPAAVRATTLLTGLIVFALLVWMARHSDAWRHAFGFTGQQTDYLNLLVDGMLQGNLHLDVELTYAPTEAERGLRQPEPMLMDASYYDGRYYLYFGVVPVVLVMLPYSALTGHDLSTNVVILLFLALGYAASLQALHRLRAAYFPDLALGWHALLAAVLGLGGIQPFLVGKADFYEVVIAGAYTFCLLAGLAVIGLFTGSCRPLLRLALASLCLGLAVGCRPTTLLALPALLWPAWHLWRIAPSRDRAAFLRLVLALIGPALAVGLALAAYNYARFGDPTDLGFSYSVNSFTDSGAQRMALAFIPANLSWYFFSLPSLSPYFPFFFPVPMPDPPAGYFGFEPVHGQAWLTFTIALGALGWCLSASCRAALLPAKRALCAVILMGVGPGLMVIPLSFRANRYLADFQPILVLALVGFLGVLLAHRAHRLARWSLAVSIPLGLVATVGSALQQYDGIVNLRPNTTAKIARWADWPAMTAHRLGLLPSGPVAFEVIFPASSSPPRAEPLLTIGLPNYADILIVGLHPGNVVEFSLDNSRLGGPRSAPRHIEPGRVYRMTMETGAFYPPATHDWGDGTNATQRAAIKHRAIITFDGEEIINRPMRSSDAPPWTLTPGRNDVNHRPFSNRFSGRISNLQRVPSTEPPHDSGPASRTLEAGLAAGWFRLELTPPRLPGAFFPLLATGQTGAGNMLAIARLDAATFELTLDSWGVGLSRSGPLPLPAAGPLQLDIVIPFHLVPDSENLGRHLDTLQVWLGSTCVWQLRVPAHIETFARAVVGANPQGFSSGAHIYEGEIQRLTPPPAEAATGLDRVYTMPPPRD